MSVYHRDVPVRLAEAMTLCERVAAYPQSANLTSEHENYSTATALLTTGYRGMDLTALPTDGRTWIVGLTGSIGMGKSTVSQMLRTLEVPVNDADAAVHAMYAHGGVAVAEIGEAFPEAVEDGAVSRPKLFKCVVGNSEAMQRLEAIVHPLVKAARDTFLAEVRSSGQLLAVLDIPLLFEKDLQSTCDEVLVVSATAAIQRDRVLARPNMTVTKFEDILARQVPDDEKRLRANSVIDTACSLEATRAAVCEFVSARRSRKQQVSEGEQSKAVLFGAAATVDEGVLCDAAAELIWFSPAYSGCAYEPAFESGQCAHCGSYSNWGDDSDGGCNCGNGEC